MAFPPFGPGRYAITIASELLAGPRTLGRASTKMRIIGTFNSDKAE